MTSYSSVRLWNWEFNVHFMTNYPETKLCFISLHHIIHRILFFMKEYSRLLLFTYTILHTLTLNINWRPPRKSGYTPKTTKVRVVSYAIIQSHQWFSELTHSSSEASNCFYYTNIKISIIFGEFHKSLPSLMH